MLFSCTNCQTNKIRRGKKEGETQQHVNPTQQPHTHTLTSRQGKPNKTVPDKKPQTKRPPAHIFRPPIVEEKLENRVQQKGTGARM